MNTEHSFIAERALAQHCEALLCAAQPAQQDHAAMLAGFGRDLAEALAMHIAALTGASAARSSAKEAEMLGAYELVKEGDEPSIFMALSLGEGMPEMMLMMRWRSVLGLIDRAYGGRGEVEDVLPENLPGCSAPVLTRFSDCVCAALGRILGEGLEIRVGEVGNEWAKVLPFAATSACCRMGWSMEEEDITPWDFDLIVEPAPFGALLSAGPVSKQGNGGSANGEQAGSDHAGPNGSIGSAAIGSGALGSGPIGSGGQGHGGQVDGAQAYGAQGHGAGNEAYVNEACAQIPITIRAIMAQFPLSVSHVAGLKPGDILPMPAPRSVPVMAGEKVLGRGRIGAIDDRYAIRLM